MKKLLTTMLSLVMILVVGFAFAGCDNFRGKTYKLVSVEMFNASGSENTFEEYKTALGITEEKIAEIKTVYGISIRDSATVKAYLMLALTASLEFLEDDVVVFNYGDNTSMKTLSMENYMSIYGQYEIVSSGLSITFKNMTYSDTGFAIDSNGNYIIEQTSKISFDGGKTTKPFNISVDGNKIFLNLYRMGVSGAGEVEQRLTFEKV